MESLDEKNCKSEIGDKSGEDSEKTNEIVSDRESSVESFYTNKSEISNTADSELIDVDDIELSDEESWLYKSPKKLASSEKQSITQKWLLKSEETDNLELHVSKDALVSKLKQLKLHGKAKNPEVSTKSLTTAVVEVDSTISSKIDVPCVEKCEPKQCPVKGKENEVLDVTDVHKIAQLQEESLRQSTSKFLSQGDRGVKSNGQGKNCVVQSPKLTKPASIEALNVWNGKVGVDMNITAPVQSLKKQNLFGSASLLSKQDAHRSSLPNINPGYYSLRSNKSKRTDSRMACPLPMYPIHLKSSNGAVNESPNYESLRKSSHNDYREAARTLPSSYRVNGRSSSASRKDLVSSPRRDSTPFPPNSRNSPTSPYPRRESAPCNPPKYCSPVSSPTLHQRGSLSSLVLQSPFRNPPNYMKSPPSAEYHRSTSHSPSRRLPLTTMHNRSPKHGNSPASPRKEDVQTLKLASKIPSPGLRSGIPVPSSYMARVNSDDESWSHDCF